MEDVSAADANWLSDLDFLSNQRNVEHWCSRLGRDNRPRGSLPYLSSPPTVSTLSRMGLPLSLEVTRPWLKREAEIHDWEDTNEATQRRSNSRALTLTSGYSAEEGLDLCTNMRLCKVAVLRKISCNLPYCNKPQIPYNHIFIFW